MAARVTSGSWARERRVAMPRLLPRRVRSLHTLALVLLLVLIGWLGWLWYRSSSFVKVESVKVTGLSGPDVPQIRDALTAAALQMTTLNVDIQKLEASVSEYSYVRALTVTGTGAHGVAIHVAEQVPVAYVETGGRRQVVDADGALLPRTTTVYGALPVVPVTSVAAGNSVTIPGARAAIAVLAAAPYAFLAHIASATSSRAHGVIVQLRNGPQLYFGPSTQLAQKWDAVVAVLQNSESVGASYIDVTDPSRPAPGVGVAPSQAAALGLASSDTGAATGASAGNTGNTGNTSPTGG
jgi:cell division protein FtsQ